MTWFFKDQKIAEDERHAIKKKKMVGKWAHTLVLEQNDWMQLAHEKLDIYEKKLIGYAVNGIDTGRCIFCVSLQRKTCI